MIYTEVSIHLISLVVLWAIPQINDQHCFMAILDF